MCVCVREREKLGDSRNARSQNSRGTVKSSEDQSAMSMEAYREKMQLLGCKASKLYLPKRGRRHEAQNLNPLFAAVGTDYMH